MKASGDKTNLYFDHSYYYWRFIPKPNQKKVEITIKSVLTNKICFTTSFELFHSSLYLHYTPKKEWFIGYTDKYVYPEDFYLEDIGKMVKSEYRKFLTRKKK